MSYHFAFTNIPIINKQKHQESVRTWTTWNTDTLLNTTANTSGTTQRLKLPHDPGVLLLEPLKDKDTNSRTKMFIATFFTVAKRGVNNSNVQ